MAKRAFTFPGQGSQAVGMGKELAETYAEARAVFDEVNQALGEDLAKIMLEGPDETLRLTENAQPALMAVSMAVVRVLEAKGVSVSKHADFVAGHSLGEYSALCAAGVFSVSDTARLLRIRGKGVLIAGIEVVPRGRGAKRAGSARLNTHRPEISGLAAGLIFQSSGPCQAAGGAPVEPCTHGSTYQAASFIAGSVAK